MATTGRRDDRSGKEVFGDSLDQDIYPALAVGIPAVWLRTEQARADDKAPDAVV